MKGKHVFTANDVLSDEARGSNGALLVNIQQNGSGPQVSAKLGRPAIHRTSITASHYALDSHAVRKREPRRVHLDGFFSYRCTPYTVPYEVMVPDAPLGNLLAPVPVSATHVGFSTVRMEPCWMALGQAAGLAAALCLDAGVSAEKVDINRLQHGLLDQGAVLVHDPKLWEDGVGDEERKTMQWEWLEAAKARK